MTVAAGQIKPQPLPRDRLAGLTGKQTLEMVLNGSFQHGALRGDRGLFGCADGDQRRPAARRQRPDDRPWQRKQPGSRGKVKPPGDRPAVLA